MEKVKASVLAGKIEIQKRAALHFSILAPKLRCRARLVREEFWAEKLAKNRLKNNSTWPIFELELVNVYEHLYELYCDPPIITF